MYICLPRVARLAHVDRAEEGLHELDGRREVVDVPQDPPEAVWREDLAGGEARYQQQLGIRLTGVTALAQPLRPLEHLPAEPAQ